MTNATSKLPQHESEDDLVLSLDAFVRSIGIRRNVPIAFLVGAGASISSGIPSAQTCIWECKLEVRAGIIAGHGTPLAARQASVLAARMTLQECADTLHELGTMSPSKSTPDRLPKHMSGRWEEHREAFEDSLRADAVTVPAEARTLAVSLDGVMAPMKDGERQAKRAVAQAAGRAPKGPAGYQEVGCGTVSCYDGDGQRLNTLRIGRMPEANRATLKQMLSAEVEAVLRQRPDLEVVKLADGARDNWSYLDELAPQALRSERLVDFSISPGTRRAWSTWTASTATARSTIRSSSSNLVAGGTREGRVLKTLLDKLEAIRRQLRSDRCSMSSGGYSRECPCGTTWNRRSRKAVTARPNGWMGRLTDEQVVALTERERVLYGESGDVRRRLADLAGETEHERYLRLLPGRIDDSGQR